MATCCSQRASSAQVPLARAQPQQPSRWRSAINRVRNLRWVPTNKQALVDAQTKLMNAVVKASTWESHQVPTRDGNTMHTLRVVRRGTTGNASDTGAAEVKTSEVGLRFAELGANLASVTAASSVDAGAGVGAGTGAAASPAALSTSSASKTKQKKPALVLAHGFGTGAAIWAHSMDDLAQHYDIHSVDLTGCGLSSRRKGSFKDHDHAEETLVQDLDAFLQNSGLERVTLVGHSFGGFIAGAYALKHPEKVERLVLVSPVGLPDKRGKTDERVNRLPVWVRPILAVTRKLWSWGTTPQSVLRLAGPKGPKLMKGYVTRRFTEEVNKDALFDYMFHVSAKRSTSETAITTILAPGIYAHNPLGPRLAKLKVPTLFMYGTHDWMDVEGAHAVVASRLDKSVPMKVLMTPNAGHNVFLDRPRTFSELFLGALGQPAAAWLQQETAKTPTAHVRAFSMDADAAPVGRPMALAASRSRAVSARA